MRASPFFPGFNEDFGFLSIPSWHFGAVASRKVLLASAIPGAHASSWPCTLRQAVQQGCLCDGEGTGQDRAVVTQIWGPSPMPWRPSGSRQHWEQAVLPPWASGGCSTCVGGPEALGCPGFPTYPRGREGPIGGNGNEKYFGDCQQRTWASPSLLLFFLLLLAFLSPLLFFFLFFCLSSSSLSNSLFPCSQVSTCLGNPGPTRAAGTSLHQGGPIHRQEGSRSGDTILAQGRPERGDPGATARALCASAF